MAKSKVKSTVSKLKSAKKLKPGRPSKKAVQSNNSAKFIKIPRLFFAHTLPNIDGDNDIGWILNFKQNHTLVFRKVDAEITPTFIEEVKINGLDIAEQGNNPYNICYVDISLNQVINSNISEVFDFVGTDFNDQNWTTYDDKSTVPFLFIDKNQINSMYSDGDHYFLSKEAFSFTNSAVSIAENQEIDTSPNYEFIKIECVRLNPIAPPLKPQAVQTKVMFALPCPPQWNPADVFRIITGTTAQTSIQS